MMTITPNTFKRYAKKTEWIDCQIINAKIEKGWDVDRLFGWIIKNINDEDGYQWTYEQALELKELVLASNNYRI